MMKIQQKVDPHEVKFTSEQVQLRSLVQAGSLSDLGKWMAWMMTGWL